ncbi:hypothetical protein ABIB73_000276 [Bradyrhizobium sp. F1.4.3]|uniref:hypothetical protein n=1 Tax=Bradyrhizobium sp. F1.4.3 TaxID=3156356 RepID=UPI00339933F5
MRRLWLVLVWIWSGFGLVLVFCAGMSAGQWIGFGKGARPVSALDRDETGHL